MQHLSLSRVTGVICALVFGGVSAAIGWRSGHLLAQTATHDLPFSLSDGDVFGIAGVTAVAMSAVLLNLAVAAWRSKAYLRCALGTSLWLLLVIYAAGNAVRLAAYHQASNESALTLSMERQEDDREELSTQRQKLKDLKSHPAYASTSGCSKAVTREAKTLCVAIADAAVKRARIVTAGVTPAAGSSGTASLAWATGLPTDWIAKAWPVLAALVFELSNCVAAFAVSPPPGASVGPRRKRRPPQQSGSPSRPSQSEPRLTRSARIYPPERVPAPNGATPRARRKAVVH